MCDQVILFGFQQFAKTCCAKSRNDCWHRRANRGSNEETVTARIGCGYIKFDTNMLPLADVSDMEP